MQTIRSSMDELPLHFVMETSTGQKELLSSHILRNPSQVLAFHHLWPGFKAITITN